MSPPYALPSAFANGFVPQSLTKSPKTFIPLCGDSLAVTPETVPRRPQSDLRNWYLGTSALVEYSAISLSQIVAAAPKLPPSYASWASFASLASVSLWMKKYQPAAPRARAIVVTISETRMICGVDR